MKTVKQFLTISVLGCLCVSACNTGKNQKDSDDGTASFKKIKDIVIYKDPSFYSTFPSVIKRPDGEILVAFRRAPDRGVFSETGNRHVDPNSYLVMVRSKDAETWTKEPELIYAHPFGGSQDPCLLQLRDGTLLCASYGWAFVRPDGMQKIKRPVAQADEGVVFLGGYLVRSTDGGNHWQGPFYPPHITPEINYNALGIPLPAYNRGALCEGKTDRFTGLWHQVIWQIMYQHILLYPTTKVFPGIMPA